MAAKFELKVGKSGKFSFNLKSANGQVVISSETYDDRKSALKGIESVKKNGGSEKRFEALTAKNGAPYFVLKATNGQVIVKSQMYRDARGVKRGIASVMKNAPAARVDDTTHAK
jgi:uncharacterized protein YegP (UPF0339 family)